MPFSSDKLRDNFNSLRRATNAKGEFVADVFEDPDSNEITVLPRSGNSLRGVTELSVALAKANPDAVVSYNYNADFHPVTSSDTPTDVYIRHIESWHKPGKYLTLTGESPEVFCAEVTSKEMNLTLFDTLVDAIRLSRENGNKQVDFRFGSYLMAVNGMDDAAEHEELVPAYDRRTNLPPPPPPPRKPEPSEQIGGFTLGGASKLKK